MRLIRSWKRKSPARLGDKPVPQQNPKPAVHLPLEICELIVHHTSHDPSTPSYQPTTSTILALRLVNRAFSATAAAALFHYIRIPIRSIPSWLPLLAASPIHKLIHGIYFRYTPGPVDSPDLDAEKWETATSVIKSLPRFCEISLGGRDYPERFGEEYGRVLTLWGVWLGRVGEVCEGLREGGLKRLRLEVPVAAIAGTGRLLRRCAARGVEVEFARWPEEGRRSGVFVAERYPVHIPVNDRTDWLDICGSCDDLALPSTALWFDVGPSPALTSLSLRCVEVPDQELVQCLALCPGLRSLDLDQIWPATTVYTHSPELWTNVLCAIGRCPQLTELRLARLDWLVYDGDEWLERGSFRKLQKLSLIEIKSASAFFLTDLLLWTRNTLTHVTFQRVKLSADDEELEELGWQFVLDNLLDCKSLICFDLQELSYDWHVSYPDERIWFRETRKRPYWQTDPVKCPGMWRMVIHPCYVEELCMTGRLVRQVRARRETLGIVDCAPGDEDYWGMKFQETLAMLPPFEVFVSVCTRPKATHERKEICSRFDLWKRKLPYIRRRR